MLIASRQRMIKERTALASRIRAFLLERGFALPRGIGHLEGRLSYLLDDGTNSLTLVTRTLIRTLQRELRHLSERIGEIDAMIKTIARTDETSQRLQGIPGVGPMVAASLIAVIGDPGRFKNGRDMAAFLGLVPSQHTSGDKIRLERITKHGDTGLRSLLVERRRRNCSGGAHPIQRSRSPHLNAAAPHPRRATHSEPERATYLRDSPTRLRKPR